MNPLCVLAVALHLLTAATADCQPPLCDIYVCEECDIFRENPERGGMCSTFDDVWDQITKHTLGTSEKSGFKICDLVSGKGHCVALPFSS